MSMHWDLRLFLGGACVATCDDDMRAKAGLAVRTAAALHLLGPVATPVIFINAIHSPR